MPRAPMTPCRPLPPRTRRGLATALVATQMLLWSLASTQALGAQPATSHDIADTPAYSNAVCNDGSRARYYVRKATKAEYRKKWLIVFQGGGSCYDNESCVERWNDLDRSSPPIGSHDNMVGDGGAANMSDFDNQGILDEDGYSLGTLTANPFRHFNKIHVHYCSSDSWKGRGGVQTMTGVDANGLPLNMPIVFHGAYIAEAVVDIVKKGLVDTGGVGPAVPSQQPDDATSEVVLFGQSAGASGLASQLDQFAAHLKSPPVNDGGPKVWGIIDSNDAVGLDLSVKDFGSISAMSYWSGGTADNVIAENIAVDQSCRLVYPNYPDLALCNNTGRLLLEYISTPAFVAENAHDGVINDRYELFMSSKEIRAGITAGAALFPAGMGLFRPNFSKREHVLGMNNGTFLATDDGTHPTPPHMVRSPKTSKVSLAYALGCYRDKQNGQTTAACRFANKTAKLPVPPPISRAP